MPYGEAIAHRGVRLSLHPAGHVLGSAQVRLEHGGRVWVASGDYKTEPDGTCTPFEPVPCDTFITESTFGLPIYRWPTQAALFAEIDDWWRANAAQGRASVLLCYAFGKAQRILHGVDAGIGPIVVHGAVEPLNAVYRAAGVALPPTLRVSDPGVDAALLQARAGAGAALGAGHAVDAALRQLLGCFRQRVDAAARHAPAARRRSRLRDVGPCRLAGLAAGHRRHRGRARVRDARQRGGDGALAERERAGCAGPFGPSTATRTWRAMGRRSPIRPSPGGEERSRGRRRPGMKQFAALYRELDASTSNLAKQAALQRYLQTAAPADAAWAVYFLAGGKPRQLVPTKLLRLLAQEAAGLPEWLFDESYEAVGDLAETLSLLLPPPTEAHDLGLAAWLEQHLLPLRGMPPEQLADAPARPVAPAGAGGAPRLLQAHHRRLPRRRLAPAGHAGAGDDQRARPQARRAAPDGLHPHQRAGRARPTSPR